MKLSNLSFSVLKYFLSVEHQWEVDIFEHPRICNEFSHVVDGRLVPTATLCLSHKSMEKMFEMT